jgi:hypothetical protein
VDESNLNQVWIVLWAMLIGEHQLAMQKPKELDPTIAHILAFCLVNYQTTKKTKEN